MGLDQRLRFFSRKKSPIRTLDYLINVDGYRSYWRDWDIAREFISNAVDAEEGDWGKVSIKTSGNSLEIYNKSRSLEIKDLYFGNSSQGKGIDKGYIGRFTEGMKIAIAAAARSGYSMTISFGHYTAKPSVNVQDGLRALRINIEKSETPINGTLVKIDGIKNVADILKEKIIMPNDKRIITSIQSSIQALDAKGIFVGGMYVCDNDGYAWGYNFSPWLIRMSEGRNIIDTNDIQHNLGALVQYAENKTYWRGLFNHMKAGQRIKEGDIWPFIFDMSPIVKKTISEAWKEVFGTNAVVEDELAREVSYRGGKIVKKCQLLEILAKSKAVQDSTEFIREYEQVPASFLSLQELSEKELLAYDVISSIVLRYAPAYKLEIFMALGKERENESGFCSYKKKVIAINREQLKSSQNIVDTLLEELTHAIYNTTDMSRKHADCMRLLATQMLFDDKARDYISRLNWIYGCVDAVASKSTR